MTEFNLLEPIDTALTGPGKRFRGKLKKLGIRTIKDLLWHFPTKYDDRSEFSLISDIRTGDDVTIKGVVQKVNTRRIPGRKLSITEVIVEDQSNERISIAFFNQPYISQSLKEGKVANFSGKVTSYKGKLNLQSPTFELTHSYGKEKETQHTGRLVPIYRETKGLTSRGIRYIIKPILENLPELPEYIPEDILKEMALPDVNEALQDIHFPEEEGKAHIAIKSFAFRDLFLLHLKNFIEKRNLKKQDAHPVKYTEEDMEEILSYLPFELTKEQDKVVKEILEDISKDHPMNRLLQGDVGSGKTVIAGIAALLAARNNYQSAFMAPTEILARQHYQTLTKFFEEYEGGIALLVSKEAKIFYGKDLEATEINKKDLLEDIKKGKVGIIIGTHALIQKNVKFKNLALAVVDEQHRFGVNQRAEIVKGNKKFPHFLSMSATPIPRTLTMSIFGNLDISLINELPKGRKEIITKVVSPQNRDKAYEFIGEQIKKGRQAFVVCPRIEESDIEDDSDKKKSAWDVKAVKVEYEKLSQEIFPDLNIGMLHGKMDPEEKEDTMKDFSKGKIDILVSTSVIEVGVDVPNATIMMIEGSDRFGLAQLYQFKGRVGRGEHQSFCLLFTDSQSPSTKERLESLVKAKNGFELAEMDLQLRGPGEFLGESQTGMPDIALKAMQNPHLLDKSKQKAKKILEKDPELKDHPLLDKKLSQFRKEIHLE
ncbi:MAG: DNA helicase RecG [Candidatus Colwellbacteria bacterium CG10_big_fil_rev_8_21_14_0_10_41_28]|uniref:ATP-dependent DNA helicase RecG n=1 Tax=Candidatus Colwellbacteria bacterium CG10_big_fil_rev_8_21_14_0_10_41_28 TaxID=1974539 RepID=A0A2H0VHI3_9BACT|nr:MAG: DNA helicase RecG [Candidatus Colwellbacteria bacterium CG10_big_fil_rev_8_21_14_0_10_41_28]